MSDLPEGWVRAPLGEVLKVQYGKGLPTQDRVSAGFPYVASSGTIGWSAKALVSGPVVVVGRKGNVGSVQLLPAGAWPSDTTFFISVPKELDPRFLALQLSAAGLDRLDQSTAIPGLSRPLLEAVSVTIAPLQEQHRIVDEVERRLSRIEAAVEGMRAARFKLRLARLAIEHQTFWTHGAPVARVGTLIAERLANGKSVRSRDGGFPVLRLTCLKGDQVDPSESKEGDWDRAMAEKYLVQSGDVLVARGNGSLRLVGRGGLVPADPPEVAYPDTLIRIRVDQGKVLPAYFVAIWNSAGVRKQLEAVARTTAGIYKVNQGHLANVNIPVPSPEAQAVAVAEFQRRTSLVDAAERTINASEARAALLRQAIGRDALLGRILKAEPSTGQSAADLLECLRARRTGTKTRRETRMGGA
jgi:type I restriction enzyme S subunit